MRDITDRHAAEQKTIESEGQLQTIFNEAPDANCNRRSAKYY
jgi:PAS domain-containing protein